MTEDRRGLFLDLDGTLADSVPVMRDAYDRFLANFGKTGSEHEFDRLNGPPMRRVVAALRRGHGLEASLPELRRAYAALVAKAYRRVEPNPGADILLRAAVKADWTVGVVTSARQRTAEAWLRRTGFGGRVSVVIGAEKGGAGKPHPDPYLAALEAARCGAAQSIAVEDSPLGATAAVAAGLRTWVLCARPGDVPGWPPVAGFVDRLDGLAAELTHA